MVNFIHTYVHHTEQDKEGTDTRHKSSPQKQGARKRPNRQIALESSTGLRAPKKDGSASPDNESLTIW